MASIDRRGTADGYTYRVRWRDKTDRVVHSRARTFNTLEEAESFKKSVEYRQALAWKVEARAWITFREVAESRLAITLAVQEDTRARQRKMLEAYVFPIIGDREFAVLTPEDVLDCITPLVVMGRTPKTVKNHLDLISQVFRFGMQRGLRPDNPCQLLPVKGLRDRTPQHRRTLLNPAEAALLIDCAEPPARLLLQTLLVTGLRWGEVSALKVGDVRLGHTRPYLDVTKAWKRGSHGPILGPPKSKNAIRQAPLPPGLVPLLSAQIRGRSPQEFLFVDDRGQPWEHSRFYRQHWAPTVERARAAGLSQRPRLHDLRHTFASWVMEESSIYAAYKLLGHATSQTTADLYGGLTTALQDSILQRMDERAFGASRAPAAAL